MKRSAQDESRDRGGRPREAQDEALVKAASVAGRGVYRLPHDLHVLLRHRPRSISRLRKRYYAALERADLRRLRFHDLRHAFGSAAITKLDAHAVQSYKGHQHYSTTQRYLHHKPRREDAAKLADAFESTSEADTNSDTNLETSGHN
jgi:integrase